MPSSVAVKNLSVSLLCIALIACALLLTRRASAAIGNINRAAETLAGYVESQTAQLSSERNQKSIQAGIDAAATFQSVGRSINVQTLPRINRTVDSLTRSADSLNSLITSSNARINSELMPAATAALKSTDGTIRAGGETAQQMTRSIAEFTQHGTLTLDDARKLINSPEWDRALRGLGDSSQQLAMSARNITEITANTAEASRQMPAIAADIHKFSSSTARFRKLILAAQIVSAIAPFVR